MKRALLKSCAVLIFALSTPTYALRCGHSLVDIGDRKGDVLDKCGDPDYSDRHYETRLVQNGMSVGSVYPNNNLGIAFGQQRYTEVQIVVDEWVYDFGRLRFQQSLRFENGVLTEINELNRGR